MSTQDNQTILILKSAKAFLENGHYKLKGGQHSTSYLQCRLALVHRKHRLELSKKLAHLFSKREIKAVAGFTVSGLLLAEELSHLCGWKLVIGEEKENRMVSFVTNSVSPNEPVLLIDDVLTTGEYINHALQALKDVNVFGVGFLVDRSRQKVNFGVPYEAVTKVNLDLYDEEECPMCRRGEQYENLSAPETNPLPVFLSLPTETWKATIKGYKDVYTLQNKADKLRLIEHIEATLPLAKNGLPRVKVDEDVRLTQYVDEALQPVREKINISREVLSDMIGHLLALINIRQETRTVGCTIIIGDTEAIGDLLPIPSIIMNPLERINHRNLSKLIPLYDLHDEQDYAFIFDRKGEFSGIRRLMTQSGEAQGLRLAQSITSKFKSATLIIKKNEKGLRIYFDGRLNSGAMVSEKSGVLEFKDYVSSIKRLSNLTTLPKETILQVLDVCIELAQRGFGAIFIVGNDAKIRDFFRTIPKFIASLDMDSIINIAKQDGASIISGDGKMLGFSYIVSLKGSITDKTKGHARHAAGLNASLQNPNSLVFIVSQNRTITIYKNGKRVEEV